MSELLLQTRNLTKQYGRHRAVDDVNMHIKKGAIYGFIGRNGAGKTTCLKMISGLSTPSYGCLLYTSPSPRDRTRYRMPSSA